MKFHFFKYDGLGNDYLVLDPNCFAWELSPETIRLFCHRHFGVGSDGILLGPFLENGQMSLRIFNPDGSEAEKSGNGVRIFSRYLVDAGYVTGSNFSLTTLGGQVEVELLAKDGSLSRVDMGAVSFLSSQVPVKGSEQELVGIPWPVQGENLLITCLSVGNPHCVILRDEVSAEEACRLGPVIERHERFPQRINVQFLKVLDRRNIQIEIWERGAGYTLASGSSSCAAAAAAYRLGLVDEAVDVHMPGGVLAVEQREDGHVLQSGAVSFVGKGCFAEELLRQGKS